MEYREWDKNYRYDIIDRFGKEHTVFGHKYTYTEANDVLIFKTPGVRVEHDDKGQEYKRAEMELVARFNDVGGFLIWEVEDAS